MLLLCSSASELLCTRLIQGALKRPCGKAIFQGTRFNRFEVVCKKLKNFGWPKCTLLEVKAPPLQFVGGSQAGKGYTSFRATPTWVQILARSTISQLHGLEQVTDHLWISVFSFVKWREYHLAGSVVVRFKERSMMTNVKPWQAINTWYFKKCILIVIQIAQTGEIITTGEVLRYLEPMKQVVDLLRTVNYDLSFFNKKYMYMLFFLPSEQEV